MSKACPSIFEETGVIDISGFAPKAAPDAQAPSAAAVKAVAEAANFRSREAPAQKSSGSSGRAPRRYRTGRNVQFNVKASPETVEAIYAMSDRYGWVLGQTLERAIAALTREMQSPQ